MILLYILATITFLTIPAILFSRYTRLHKPKLVPVSKAILLLVTIFTTVTTFVLLFIERPALQREGEQVLESFPSYDAIQSGEKDGISITVISTDNEKQVRLYNQTAAHDLYLRFAQKTLYYIVKPDFSYEHVSRASTYFVNRTLP